MKKIGDNSEFDDEFREAIRKCIERYNGNPSARQESIDLFKRRLKNQVTSFNETIAKVLDKYVSLAKKIRTQFQEQGIAIASILMAVGMTISVLVEALLTGGGGGGTSGGEVHKPPPIDENVNELKTN